MAAKNEVATASPQDFQKDSQQVSSRIGLCSNTIDGVKVGGYSLPNLVKRIACKNNS